MERSSRRVFLRGAGGFSLALPWLPSLLSKEAAAQVGRRKRFVAYMTDHGGVMADSMFPDQAVASNTVNLFAGHDGRWGTLRRTVNGNTASVSQILSASATALSDRLVSKMNVYRGFDIPFGIAHNTGSHLGNYAANDGNGDEGRAVQGDRRPTIDQVMGWSPSFYGNAAGIRERVMFMGDRNWYSWVWSSPTSRTGTIQDVPATRSARDMFRRIFVANNSQTPVAARKPIIDRVLENYRSLRQSNRRLSPSDRQRLDDHVSRLAELERNVNLNAPPPQASCSGVAPVNGDSEAFLNGSDRKQGFKLFNDVIAAAFICDTSRVASISAAGPLVPFSGSWHQDVAHRWNSPGPQETLRRHYQVFFEHVFLDLARKLDVDEGDGTSILDNTLMQWTQESGQQTHDNAQNPVVTFGSAGGFFKTGIFADYRKMNAFFLYSDMSFPRLALGINYNQWLTTALQAMGIPASEWQRPGERGYANPSVGSGYRPHHANPQLLNAVGDVAPFVKA